MNDSPVDVWMKHHTRGLLLNFALIGAAILAVAAAPFTGGGSTVVAAAAVGALMVTASVTAVQSIEEARTALKNGGYVKVSKNGGTFKGPMLPPYACASTEYVSSAMFPCPPMFSHALPCPPMFSQL